MKTKLTLTVEKEIVARAKAKAASRGISLSKMFEEIFESKNYELQKTPEQIAAIRFLERLKNEPKTKLLEKSDKELIREHWDEKYG